MGFLRLPWFGGCATLPAALAAFLAAAFLITSQTEAQRLARKTDGKVVRFASLRADDVNVRAGPGVRYPVKWKFVQRNMPVQIIAEFDTWRKIRDWEGAEGWVHRAMLSTKRSLILVGAGQTMRKEADDGAPAVARLAPGMVVVVSRCGREWCEVGSRGYEGWIRRHDVWGMYPGEKIP